LLLPATELSSTFSTFSYALYLLACVNAKGTPVRDNIVSFLAGDLGAIRATNQALGESSSLARLSALFYKARSILRLFRIIPRLAEIKNQINAPHSNGSLWATGLIESGSYTLYQGLEAVATLLDFGILPRGVHGKRGSTFLYTLAYRVWLIGVSCSAIRLLVQWRIWMKLKIDSLTGHEHHNTNSIDPVEASEEHGANHVLMLCWLPVGWSLSGWLEYQVPGAHLVLHGVGDAYSELQKHLDVWGADQRAVQR